MGANSLFQKMYDFFKISTKNCTVQYAIIVDGWASEDSFQRIQTGVVGTIGRNMNSAEVRLERCEADSHFP